MKPWGNPGTAKMPDGSFFELQRHDNEYVIHADGYELMTSYAHSSEDAMMPLACPEPPADACVLIGGLGMGFTLGATLALLPPKGKAIVAELVPEIVEWNRGPLGPLAGNPLSDPRTEVIIEDVATVIRDSNDRFDAILLDVDNGPDSFSVKGNSRIYSPDGLDAAHRSLRTGGALAIWAVGTSRAFEPDLRRAGFDAVTHPVRGHRRRGGHYSVIVGRKR